MSANDRVILHCDCNSFFASVESAINPSFNGVPMAVCGSSDNRHGIVLAKNEIAKSFGVQTAETIISAKRKCPNLVIAKPHYSAYKEYSQRANAIYSRFTDMVEPFGIDESWLDVTASQKLFGGGYEIARKISDAVKNELNITLSIGVSFNKVFAKLGSDYKKPDAITVIDRNNFKSMLYPMPVSALLFVGKKTTDTLFSLGIKSIGELASATPQMLKLKFGKLGEMLYKYANGLDDTPVTAISDDVKSISNGFTFKHDLLGKAEWKLGVDFLSDEIGSRLRKNLVKCGTVQVSIKDEYLRVVQRQRPQIPPSDISSEIAKTAMAILDEEWQQNKPIRMITVAATNLISCDEASVQTTLFDEQRDIKRVRKKETELAVDRIREKFGESAILKGALMNTDLGLYDESDE